MKTLKNLIEANDWTLFLDRDGVINVKRENDYVKSWEEFVFVDGAPEAIAILASKFKTIVVVTNQQGIGKGLYSIHELEKIHANMLSVIQQKGGRIDRIYFCGSLKEQNDPSRKPGTGMALQAKKDFPHIDFHKSVMAGDAASDMDFGKALEMVNVYIDKNPQPHILAKANYQYRSLMEFANDL